jgi:hypothetical protein
MLVEGLLKRWVERGRKGGEYMGREVEPLERSGCKRVGQMQTRTLSPLPRMYMLIKGSSARAASTR